eukprot:4521075-Pyramimonas_sp.AAC.1
MCIRDSPQGGPSRQETSFGLQGGPEPFGDRQFTVGLVWRPWELTREARIARKRLLAPRKALGLSGIGNSPW